MSKAYIGAEEREECWARMRKRSKVLLDLLSFFDIHIEQPIDLRAVLRLQPTNADAIRELTELLFPPGGDNTDIAFLDSANPSSSKQPTTVTKEKHSEKLRRLGIPEPKPTKQPPFSKTYADDRKLKIVLASGVGGGVNGMAKSRKTGSAAGDAQQQQPLKRHGKEKAGTMKTMKTKEMERMRAECATYPSWDRYEVKKVD